MKKKICAVMLLVALLVGSFCGITAFAEVSLEECDRCFQETVNALLDENDVGADSIYADRKPVYDLVLNHLGYVYEYEISGGDGYVIVICDDGEYKAQEAVNAESPYAGVTEELCVYVNSLTYLKSVDGKFYDIKTSEQITEEVLTELGKSAIYYQLGDEGTVDFVTVKVEYKSKTMDAKVHCIYPPKFSSVDIKNGCAAVAGMNIIGYYDRYYENLIPNHSAGYEYLGSYVYNLQDTYVNNALKELYSDMDGSDKGITEPNFINGLKKYCARKGYNCDLSSLMSSGKLSYDKVKDSIKANKPVALLLSTYNFADIFTENNTDSIEYRLYYGDHIMAGFGYRDVTYTLNNGSTSNYKFILVSSGFSEAPSGYFNINYSTNINAAYGVNIY